MDHEKIAILIKCTLPIKHKFPCEFLEAHVLNNQRIWYGTISKKLQRIRNDDAESLSPVISLFLTFSVVPNPLKCLGKIFFTTFLDF